MLILLKLSSRYTLCVQHLHMWMAHKYCQALLLTPSVDRLICWIYHQASVTILMETNFQKAFAERCFSLIDEYAPGFSTSVVGYDMLTPPDLEREFGLTGKLFPIVYTTVCIPCILDPFDVLLNCTYWRLSTKKTWFTFHRGQHFPRCNGLRFSFPHEACQGMVIVVYFIDAFSPCQSLKLQCQNPWLWDHD